jgi:putative phosphoribosyl transferase
MRQSKTYGQIGGESTSCRIIEQSEYGGRAPTDGESFADRLKAGAELAKALAEYRDTDAVVVGLARGGVVVASAVAQTLGLPLRALVVRKVGAPQNPELALGAVSETGVRWIDYNLVRLTGATPAYLEQEIEEQVAEARRRQEQYGIASELATIAGKTAIIVDDGIATGASALVAVRSARDLGAVQVVLATPAASRPAVHALEARADRVIALLTPDPFFAVGMYYRDFGQVSDEEVIGYLAHSSGTD